MCVPALPWQREIVKFPFQKIIAEIKSVQFFLRHSVQTINYGKGTIQDIITPKTSPTSNGQHGYVPATWRSEVACYSPVFHC